MMRVCLVLAALLAMACPALATDWRFLAAHDDRSVELYYDRHSVRKTGDLVRVRVKRVYAEDEGRDIAAEHGVGDVVAFVVEQVTLDCPGRRQARMSAWWYGKNGKVLDRVVAASGMPWRPLRPGGLGEALCEELN
uniref:Surface-adhesin protein E-like domain-containing protein n=1 Tax=Desulfovibrio sp. U5L TaxID=596152 RepID=I2Q0C1_9BACT